MTTKKAFVKLYFLCYAKKGQALPKRQQWAPSWLKLLGFLIDIFTT